MADSTTRRLSQYHSSRYHRHLHKPAPDTKVETIYAPLLGPATAAAAAHSTTNKWEGVRVIPLDAADEIHFAWMTPHDFSYKDFVYVRLLYIPNNASSGTVITVTYDKVSMGTTAIGSDAAADGASTFSETIESVTDAQTDADEPLASPWGKIVGSTSDYDVLFLKIVAGTASAADRLHVWGLQIGYHPLTA
jgi:hypothetical protein